MTATARISSSPRLRALPSPPAEAHRRHRSAPGVVAQVRTALRPRNRTATLLGAALGGAVPIAAYRLAHAEVDPSQPLWLQVPAWLVAGALLFSATTVFGWAREAFGSATKALGYTVLAEGILTFARTPWLGIGAVCYLVAINSVATGVRLSFGGRR